MMPLCFIHPLACVAECTGAAPCGRHPPSTLAVAQCRCLRRCLGCAVAVSLRPGVTLAPKRTPWRAARASARCSALWGSCWSARPLAGAPVAWSQWPRDHARLSRCAQAAAHALQPCQVLVRSMACPNSCSFSELAAICHSGPDGLQSPVSLLSRPLRPPPPAAAARGADRQPHRAARHVEDHVWQVVQQLRLRHLLPFRPRRQLPRHRFHPPPLTPALPTHPAAPAAAPTS